jgi:tetratricopeptide (TPR) repeat protein
MPIAGATSVTDTERTESTVVVPPRPSDNYPKQRRILTDRALAAARQGDWAEALAANQELLALNDSVPEVHNRVGKALAELGRYREAHAAYTRSIELEPHNSIAQRNLRRLENLKDLADEDRAGHPLVRSYQYIEETGRTATVSLTRPAPLLVRARMMSGDAVHLRVDEEHGRIVVENGEGDYLGEIEPRIGERMLELIRGGNRYAAAIVELEEDTLRVMLREVYQDPSLNDRLSFPTRVRGAAPRAYIRRDILSDALDDSDSLIDSDDDEVEAEETEEEPEIEDEEFSDDDMEDSNL